VYTLQYIQKKNLTNNQLFISNRTTNEAFHN